MAVIKALKIRDKDRCQYSREGNQTISCPSVPVELVFPLPLLRKASSSVLPLMHARDVRTSLHLFFCLLPF